MRRNNSYHVVPDLIKGIAIIWIVSFHMYKDFPHIFYGKGNFAYDFVHRFMLHGSLGVDLFVIISGYLLARSCLRKVQINWIDFLKKRIRRIFPLYWMAIGSVLLLEVLIGSNSESYKFKSIIYHFLGIHGLTSYIFDLQGAWWFITLILQLYLLFPLLWYIIERKPMSLILAMAAALTILARMIPIANFDSNYSLFAFLIVFILGIAMARSKISDLNFPLSFRWISYCLVSIVLFIVAIYSDKIELFSYAQGLLRPFVSFGIFIFLSFLCNHLISKLKYVSWPLSKYGKYSYAIYLFHRPLIYKWVTITSTIFDPVMVWIFFLALMFPLGIIIERGEAIFMTTLNTHSRRIKFGT